MAEWRSEQMGGAGRAGMDSEDRPDFFRQKFDEIVKKAILTSTDTEIFV
jgi:hypothetical protein